jgi:glycosyltransferase involved in cell wall biosynthesis
MIHLIIRLPLPYQQTLCQTLSDAYGGAFVAWFAERNSEEFPYRSSTELQFAHHYLAEVGYWKLYQELRADPEAVVILGGWSSPMTNKTLLMTTLLRVPVFVWADHPHPRKRSWVAARSRKLYLRFLARVVAGFLACGEPTVEHLASLGIERSRITNFPYWVELPLEWSVPRRCVDDEMARQPLRLLAIGRLVPVKQFAVAIEAVALANRRASSTLATLVIAGDGPERKSLGKLASSLKCESSIQFPGWLEPEDVCRTLRESDALIVPSQFEPFGVVVLESMAQGRTVLASQQVIAALDRDLGTGAVLLHLVGDVEALANQVSQLATDSVKLAKGSVAARATAESWAPARAAAILDEILSRRHIRMSPRSNQSNVLTSRSIGDPTEQRIEVNAVASGGR